MKVDLASNLQEDADAIVTLAFDTESGTGTAFELGPQTTEYLRGLKQREELSCQFCKVNLLHQVPGVASPVLLVVGAGKLQNWNAQSAHRCAAAATKALATKNRRRVVMHFGVQTKETAQAAVAGAMNGCCGQDLLKAEKSLHPIDRISWFSMDSDSLRWGNAMGQAMLLARELVNLPANTIYPETFANRAQSVAKECGLQVEVWDELRLRKERCGALLGVAQGSARPPRLVILKYAGKTDAPPLALIGKGVTFDSGGLSLKPSDSMMTMKCDMAGAATVLAAMQAISQLQLDQPVVGLMGLVENMVSGTSFRLGDVLTARNGKTIEIHNTDAEGRLVLADVLDVARQFNPSSMIDLATLTGACVVALGTDIVGAMTNNPSLQAQFQQVATTSGEDVWPLPMHDFFSEQIKSKVADLKNMGEGRWGGAITAAKFLQEFVGETPWLHLDIAGPAFLDSAKSYQDAGASGVMVRSLINFAAHAK